MSPAARQSGRRIPKTKGYRTIEVGKHEANKSPCALAGPNVCPTLYCDVASGCSFLELPKLVVIQNADDP